VPPKPSGRKPASREPQTVEAFLTSLEHPFKQEVLALRQIILGADPGIAEGTSGTRRASARREEKEEKKKKRVPCSNGMNRSLRTVYATAQQRLPMRV